MATDWLSQLDGPEYHWTPPLSTSATEGEIAALRAFAPRPLPDDYVAFLRRYGGAEVWYRDMWCVVVLSPPDVPPYSEGYGFSRRMPEALLFGNDGGGEGLIFDMRPHHPDGHYPVLAINYVSVGWDEALHVADSFRELVLLRHELLDQSYRVE